jgi:hypothetical protein
MFRSRIAVSVFGTVSVLVLAGCDRDGRLVQATREADQRQAQQNQLIAKQSQQVAAATRQLIEADAKARHELIAAQAALETKLQDQRAGLDRQHEGLEQERREVAEQRNRDPIIAAAIIALGITVACLLPLAFCIYLLRAVSSPDIGTDSLAEMLVLEMASEQPTLLSGNADEHPRLSESSPRGEPPAVDHSDTPHK